MTQLVEYSMQVLEYISNFKVRSVWSETCPFLPQNHGAGCYNSSFLGRFPIEIKAKIGYLIVDYYLIFIR